jgi:hypothetical protein
MNEYRSEVANSIKFVVEGEWVDASSKAPIDVISPATEHGPAEHAIAGLGRAAGGMSRLAGCGVQRVSVAAYCTEYFVSYLTHLCRGVVRASGLGATAGRQNDSSRLRHDPGSIKYPGDRGEAATFTNANIATAFVPRGCARRLLVETAVIAAAVQCRRASTPNERQFLR